MYIYQLKHILTISILLFLSLSQTFRLNKQQIKPTDYVSKLPHIDIVTNNKMQSGQLEVDNELQNNIQYWFTESDSGNSAETPVVMWMNGGPGASSSIGLLAENIGLQSIAEGGQVKLNKDRWTKFAHVVIFDNPVGSGQSQTNTGSQVKNETEMAVQLTKAIQMFLEVHPEYKKNKFWVAGESYAGKQIPNLASYILKNNIDINLSGIIMGNGVYEPITQQNTVGDYAYSHGLIDDNKLNAVNEDIQKCINQIKEKKMVKAAEFCEDIVADIYDKTTGAFRYDIKQFTNILADLDSKIRAWIEDPAVKSALHIKSDAKWEDADETGPVADNLRADFMTSNVDLIEQILDSNLPVLMYNGERDGSSCNHIGNMKVANILDWKHKDGFKNAVSTNLYTDAGSMVGFIKKQENFSYLTVVNTGHLVPMFVPEEAAYFVSKFIANNL